MHILIRAQHQQSTGTVAAQALHSSIGSNNLYQLLHYEEFVKPETVKKHSI
jgi:hypothetical protein